MAEHLESLLKKIEGEAINRVEAQSREKLEQAEQQARKIVADAEAKAKALVEKAEAQATLREENGRKNLDQAARDFLLLVRKSMSEYLSSLIGHAVTQTSTPDFLEKVLGNLLPSLVAQSGKGITIEVSPEAQEALAKGFMAKLATEAQKGITLRPAKGVRAGFRLALEGKDIRLDLTDEALVEVLSQLVNAEVARALANAAKA